ncbi:phosphate ABC transporter membrane protein 2, PhoT family [Haladaptatus litoreus]|uniref:Phosphate transport system permease protein PstA n=1 Tax=Haladaptatus litoreus TaxID=553468 RepID=A0A1N6W961_9EURY|nr:phosphate ABC transporter permease PstA [Haladaptatus litoreus]SIQ86681.1 phosphate ABC transporter membrane protein 2, PhoT family [Haladaptatus litoreus]
MSSTFERDTALVDGEKSILEWLSYGIVALGIVTPLLTATTFLRETTEGTSLVGIGLLDVFALLTALIGFGVLGIGVGSWSGRFETTPDERTGAVTGVGFGIVALVVTGLTVSQTFGFGAVVWVPVAVVVGALVAVGVLAAREDLGTTVPVGLFALGLTGLVLGDVLTVSWSWEPTGLSAAFPGYLVVPALAGVTGLLGAWAGSLASEGFGSRGRQRGAFALIGLSAIAMLAVLAMLLLFIGRQGFGYAFSEFSVGIGPAVIPMLNAEIPFVRIQMPFVTNGYTFRPDEINGVFPAVVGTFWVVVGAVLVGVPLAVAAAVFLTEYAEQGWFTQVVEVATNGLWSTPSVVFGLFGYAFLVPRLGNDTSLLAGMLVLGFMLIPLVLITSREAVLAVPDEYRDASAALGVSQWETIKSVVLPAAMPGILTGVILGVGRIAGETAPILLVMAGGLRDSAPKVLGAFEFSSVPPFVTNDALLASAPTLPYQLYASITAGVSGENAEAFGWGTAFVLLLVVLSFYAVGIGTRIYFRRKLQQ